MTTAIVYSRTSFKTLFADFCNRPLQFSYYLAASKATMYSMIILSINSSSSLSQMLGCLTLHINSIYQIKSILNVMQSSNRFNFSKIINLWYDWKFENNIFLFLIFIFLHFFSCYWNFLFMSNSFFPYFSLRLLIFLALFPFLLFFSFNIYLFLFAP